MAEPKTRPSDAALTTGPGRVLLLVYGVFALSASARALVQITTHFDEAPLAYLLSALAALVYIAATAGLAIGGRRGRSIALTSCTIELVGVLVVGTLTVVDRNCALFNDLPAELQVWNSHGDKLTKPPKDFIVAATTENSDYAAIENPKKKMFGLQFHPEVAHTPRGKDVLRNFVQGIAGIEPSWTAANFIETTVAGIRDRVDRPEFVAPMHVIGRRPKNETHSILPVRAAYLCNGADAAFAPHARTRCCLRGFTQGRTREPERLDRHRAEVCVGAGRDPRVDRGAHRAVGERRDQPRDQIVRAAP